jgi:hypothetical protein
MDEQIQPPPFDSNQPPQPLPPTPAFLPQQNPSWFYRHKFLVSFITGIALLAVAGLGWYFVQNQTRQDLENLSNTQVPIPPPPPAMKPINADHGTLSGTVTIGPFCPVTRIDEDCPGPENAYTSTKIIAYEMDGITQAASVNLTANGDYSMDLNPGTYLVTSQRLGQEYKPIPQQVTINTSQTTTLDMAIDTGIR